MKIKLAFSNAKKTISINPYKGTKSGGMPNNMDREYFDQMDTKHTCSS